MPELTPAEAQLLRDRQNPEYAQAKGHNQRVKERYPEAWACSTITNQILTDWVIEHKNDKCPYCNSPVAEIDHIQPLSKGGPHDLDNMEMLCMECNRQKHDMTKLEFSAWRATQKPVVKGYAITDFGINYKDLKHSFNRYRTRSLFKEMWVPKENRDLPPIFSLKAHDHTEDFISLRRLYLDIGDPTEYRFAKLVFNDPNHWRKLSALSWMEPYIKEWRAELKAKIRAESVERIIAMSSSNLQAIRALATEDYLYTSYLDLDSTKAKPKRVGRPNKEKEVEEVSDDVLDADAARIGL